MAGSALRLEQDGVDLLAFRENAEPQHAARDEIRSDRADVDVVVEPIHRCDVVTLGWQVAEHKAAFDDAEIRCREAGLILPGAA